MNNFWNARIFKILLIFTEQSDISYTKIASILSIIIGGSSKVRLRELLRKIKKWRKWESHWKFKICKQSWDSTQSWTNSIQMLTAAEYPNWWIVIKIQLCKQIWRKRVEIKVSIWENRKTPNYPKKDRKIKRELNHLLKLSKPYIILWMSKKLNKMGDKTSYKI